jgi:phage terminase small subunit
VTVKQRRFVEEYTGPAAWNATQAAKNAGYSEKTAYSQGQRLLKHVEVKLAIEERLAELSMTAAEATKRLTDWGRGSAEPFMVFYPDGTFGIDLATEAGRANLHLIRKLEQTERIVESGDAPVLERKTKIELHDAKDAVVQIAKIRRLYGDNPDGVSVSIAPAVHVYLPANERQDEQHPNRIAALAATNGHG